MKEVEEELNREIKLIHGFLMLNIVLSVDP